MANGAVSYSDGEDAEALAEEMGLDLIPWQRPVLYDLCARDERDRPAYVTAGLSVPRQNGKNAILEAFELYVLAVCGWHVLHTAHRVKTTKKSFRRLVRYFTDKRHPDVCALVESIRYTNGEEAIYLTNGGSIEFSARSRAGNRGFDDIQLVVFDEAQELTDDQMKALARKRGVAQVTLYKGFLRKNGEATILDAIEHLNHMVSLMGVEHVGIGTDFDGDGGIPGCASAAEVINFTRRLLAERYSETDIAGIWGGNFLRVMQEVQDNKQT